MSQRQFPSSENNRRQAAMRARRKRQIRRNRIIFACGCLLLLALVGFGLFKLIKILVKPGDDAGSKSTPSSASTSVMAPVSTKPESDSTSDTPPAQNDDWLLTLVNNNVALPSDWSVETEVAEATTQKELASEAAKAYKTMKAAAATEGIDLLLCSGYRSVEYQQGLFDKQVKKWTDKGYSAEEAYNEAKTVVAVPGYSEHNSGLAADIVTPKHQTLDAAFADTDAGKWLAEHAPEYGFILRYPENKQTITGIIYEPWHFRYVGIANAKAISESGKCLEEYLDSNV